MEQEICYQRLSQQWCPFHEAHLCHYNMNSWENMICFPPKLLKYTLYQVGTNSGSNTFSNLFVCFCLLLVQRSMQGLITWAWSFPKQQEKSVFIVLVAHSLILQYIDHLPCDTVETILNMAICSHTVLSHTLHGLQALNTIDIDWVATYQICSGSLELMAWAGITRIRFTRTHCGSDCYLYHANSVLFSFNKQGLLLQTFIKPLL